VSVASGGAAATAATRVESFPCPSTVTGSPPSQFQRWSAPVEVESSPIVETAPDGNVPTVIRADGDALTVREVFPAEEFVNRRFSPDGTRVLLPPYPSDPGCVVATWPELDIAARLEVAADLPEVQIGIDV
jgi:hypothetical protein